MMRNISTFDKKWLKVIVLLISMAILLIVGSAVFGAEGTPLTTGEFFTYEQDGLFIMKFTALISFDVVWEDTGGGVCWQESISPPAAAPFYMYSPDFLGANTGGLFVKKTNLGEFSGSCVFTESYVAGNNYIAYMVDFNNPIEAGDSTTTIKADSLRDKDEETSIDEESIFKTAEVYNEVQWVSRDFYLGFIPEIDINYPLDEAEIAGNFTMEIDFSDAGGYNRLMIVFEDWDIGSSCPPPSDPNYQEEFDIYFNNRSLPYFSSFLSTSTGSTTIEIGDLEVGEYNCNKCYFLTTTGRISENVCVGYDLNVLSYIPPIDFPEVFLDYESWENYYSEHSERFATSTPIFTNMAETFEPLINWIGNTILFFNNYFDPDNAKIRGEEIGNAVRSARGYLESIDDFFGGLPISTIFIFYLITTIVIIVYRLVKGILTIIVP